MNRIAQYLPDDAHPLDAPPLPDRQRMLQVACGAVIVGTVGVVIAITLVVRFALGGRPILQNGALVSGIPIVTVVGAILTLTAAAAATTLGPLLRSAGLKGVAAGPPPAPEPGTVPETATERLWAVYARGKFAEYALADGAAVATAVLYHLSADWLMILFVAGMVAYLIVRFPTRARMRAWYDAAAAEVEQLKNNSGE